MSAQLPSAAGLAALRERGGELPDLGELVAHGVPLPSERLCAYLSGSFASGFAHAASDFDVFVVTEERYEPVDPTGVGHVSIAPHDFPIVIRHLPAARCDVEYWQRVQVDRLIEKFAVGSGTLGFTVDDVDFLYRLSIAHPLEGEDWLRERQDALAGSAFRSMLVQQYFGTADSLFEDALGMLEIGDLNSAVLAAHDGYGRAVDGLLAAHGEFSPRRKWRARKFVAAAPPELDAEDHWAVETMRDLDPADPAAWVRSTIRSARDFMMEVEL
jgi:hypothetical protein